MLGDPARFTGGNMGLADRVLQRRLAVVNVAHEGHDGGTGFQILRGIIVFHILGINFFRFLFLLVLVFVPLAVHYQSKAHLFRHFLGDFRIDGLVDTGKHIHHHEGGNDFIGAFSHGIRQRFHHHGGLDMDLATGSRGISIAAVVVTRGELAALAEIFIAFSALVLFFTGAFFVLGLSAGAGFHTGFHFFDQSILGVPLFHEFVKVGLNERQVLRRDIIGRSTDIFISLRRKLLEDFFGRQAVFIGERLHFNRCCCHRSSPHIILTGR